MMKKTALVLFLCGALAAAALAAGDAGDPLASLSYLAGTFSNTVDEKIEARLDASDAALVKNTGSGGNGGDVAATWTEKRLKAGDTLLGSTGTNVLVLSGSVQATCTAGTVVDVSAGTTLPSGSTLTVGHRYMAAEDASAFFVVTGKTAVVEYQGPNAFQYSDETDYNAMASALKTLHLFQGSFTGYGQGFDLEAAPTRLQALIMFIRVLGEEQQALQWTGELPFTDLAKGSQAEKYVGYAYSRGYTNGYSATLFKPAGAVNAYQYTEFILRAMGYSSSANTNLADTLERGQACGLLTSGEAAMLQRDRFLRAELVYISYYALDTALPDGGTLGEALEAKGVFTGEEWKSARNLVSGERE
ncbi:S-layer homology domain-containing protein [Oscillibacter sp.]|uniref:S-layer homology domain-containing protein n=1 Tax=Oscillibacter sp. TaxID=1945593 RepID=UPI0026393076|nr:S-layer homology domain-containing protein [Oscillibacter sp.]MDD3346908.1 S-layer homology domain-containing protein [Oscillibacter sp.]